MYSQAASLKELSRSNKAEFLKQLFGGLRYDDFRFPTSGNDGCIGECCISQSHIVKIQGTQHSVALHLNFKCVPGGYDGSSLNLAITQFHLTARHAGGQALINYAGPSILTAGDSIHINRNTDWGRSDNVDNLANALGISSLALLTQLRNTEGYSQHYMSMAVNQIKNTIQQTIGFNAGHMNITWHNSDNTFA